MHLPARSYVEAAQRYAEKQALEAYNPHRKKYDTFNILDAILNLLGLQYARKTDL